jgi:hypothetical protein
LRTRTLLTDHLIEDLGKAATIDDWAGALFPDKNDSFYGFPARRRELIVDDKVKGERELLRAFNLKQNDTIRIKSFLNRPLETSAHPARFPRFNTAERAELISARSSRRLNTSRARGR